MASLTQPYEAFERPGLVVSYKISNVKIFKGAMVGLNASGYVAPMDPGTAGMKFVGIANETIDNSTGTAGAKQINLTKCGSFVLKAVSGYSPAITDLGGSAYANSDWEIQLGTSGLTNAYKIGTITNIEATSTGAQGVRVRIDSSVC